MIVVAVGTHSDGIYKIIALRSKLGDLRVQLLRESRSKVLPHVNVVNDGRNVIEEM